MNKISAVYKIVNTVTKDFYIGSSRNAMQRFREHRCSLKWKKYPNSLMYQDMEKYGVDKFKFQILAPVEPEYLTQVEQELIEMLHPTYNDKNAKGWNVERRKEHHKEYMKEYMKKCRQSDKGEKLREYNRKYSQSEKGKGVRKKYSNQPCLYNGETITLEALRMRFQREGIKHPTLEAKKYLI